MKSELLELCNLFIENRDLIKKTNYWENSYIFPVCSMIFTEKRQKVDADILRKCKYILKEKTNFFSNFRSTAKMVMISKMALDYNPEEKLENTIKAYNTLKEYFYISEFLPIAAMIVADFVPTEKFQEIAIRTRKIYDIMKKEHPFLTSSEDSVFAVLLSLSEQTNEQLLDSIEGCYKKLKPEFSSSNGVQSLSHVLALDDQSVEQKTEKTLALFKELKARGHKYGVYYELPTLGILAMLRGDLEEIVQDIIGVDEFLARQKEYGFLGIDKKQRLMHAGMIVTSFYLKENSAIASIAISNTVSLIIAQQAALCAAVAASSAAAASSASN